MAETASETKTDRKKSGTPDKPGDLILEQISELTETAEAEPSVNLVFDEEDEEEDSEKKGFFLPFGLFGKKEK